MLVMSRTTQGLVPRSPTTAKQRLEGGGQGLKAGVGVGELETTGLRSLLATAVGAGVNFAAVGATAPQPTVSRAAIAATRSQPAAFVLKRGAARCRTRP